MPLDRMTERLGLKAAALQIVATAQASQTAPSTQVATVATSNILDTYTLGDRRYLARAAFALLSTAATGAATLGVYEGTATGSMSAASVGTGTTLQQVTANISSNGSILELELHGADLHSSKRYLQFRVTPGGGLISAVSLTVDTEARYQPNTGSNVSALVTPVVVADLT